MLVGAVSVIAYGKPRTSEDIDLLIDFTPPQLKEFIYFCKKNDFDCSLSDAIEAIKTKSHFTIFDNKSTLRLDIKGIYTELDRVSFKRRKKFKIGTHSIYINTPEDCIVAKLIFGSEKDISDAESIILRQSKLDYSYLEKMAKKFKVEKKLKKLME